MSVVPRQVVDGYFKTAKSHSGTSGMILKTMCAFARKEARELIRSGARKSDVANAFERIAQECYATAQRDKWLNDYALDISDPIRKAVMSVR